MYIIEMLKSVPKILESSECLPGALCTACHGGVIRSEIRGPMHKVLFKLGWLRK